MPSPAIATDSSTIGRRPSRSAQGATAKRADAHADETCAEQVTELAVGEVPVCLDARCGERHGEDVKAVQHVETDADADGDNLKRRQWPLGHAALQVIAHDDDLRAHETSEQAVARAGVHEARS